MTDRLTEIKAQLPYLRDHVHRLERCEVDAVIGNIEWLIDEVERERAESAMLRNNLKVLKQEWKELSVESYNPCFERDCVYKSKWVFTPADKQYYCAHHAAINREKWGL